MDISKAGIDFIKQWEALELNVYKDQAGKDTIGYGHLVTGQELYEFNQGITANIAEELLRADLQDAINKVRSRIRVPVNQNQFDALVSLVFNVPDAIYSGTIEDKINANASKEILSATWNAWNKVRNKQNQLVVSNGLVRRRKAELEMFYTPPGETYQDNSILHIAMLCALAIGILLISKLWLR